jgi:hypothetical protein
LHADSWYNVADRDARPNGIKQISFGHELTGVFKQVTEHAERLWT